MKVSPPSMMRGGGGGTGVGHKAWVAAGLSLETWNVGCTRLIVGGSISCTAVGLMIFRMENGPTERGANFLTTPHALPDLVGRSWYSSLVNQLFNPGRGFDKIGANKFAKCFPESSGKLGPSV